MQTRDRPAPPPLASSAGERQVSGPHTSAGGAAADSAEHAVTEAPALVEQGSQEDLVAPDPGGLCVIEREHKLEAQAALVMEPHEDLVAQGAPAGVAAVPDS